MGSKIFHNKQLATMKTIIKLSLSIMALGLLSSASNVTHHKVDEAEGIQFFEGSWEEALKESQETGKPIFLDAYASWCGPCKALKARVFTNQEVGAYFNEHFINVEKDMEKGEGRQIARTYRVTSYPSLFFVKDDGSVVKRAVGYRNPEQLLLLGQQAIEAYENI